MIFTLLTFLSAVLCVTIVFVVIFNVQAHDARAAMAFLEEMRQIIGGTISECRICYYRLQLNGTYDGRKVECLYSRHPRPDAYPQVLFALTPLEVLKIKHFPFVYPTIGRGIRFRNGRLECKWEIDPYPKASQADLKAILDRLVEAETNFRNRDRVSGSTR